MGICWKGSSQSPRKGWGVGDSRTYWKDWKEAVTLAPVPPRATTAFLDPNYRLRDSYRLRMSGRELGEREGEMRRKVASVGP